MSTVTPLPSAPFHIGETAEGRWSVPTELALVASRSAFLPLVYRRAAAGDYWRATSTVFARGKRLFAVIPFKSGREVFLALDAWVLDDPEAMALAAVKAGEETGWAR